MIPTAVLQMLRHGHRAACLETGLSFLQEPLGLWLGREGVGWSQRRAPGPHVGGEQPWGAGAAVSQVTSASQWQVQVSRI